MYDSPFYGKSNRGFSARSLVGSAMLLKSADLVAREGREPAPLESHHLLVVRLDNLLPQPHASAWGLCGFQCEPQADAWG